MDTITSSSSFNISFFGISIYPAHLNRVLYKPHHVLFRKLTMCVYHHVSIDSHMHVCRIIIVDAELHSIFS